MLSDVLLKNFDLEDFLESSGYPLSYIGGRTGQVTTCPFCLKNLHCGVNLEEKTFGCFKCKRAGSAINLIGEILNKTYIETLEFLKTYLKDKYVDISYIGELIDQIKPYADIETKIKPIAMPEGYIPLTGKRIPYLDKRNIPDEAISYYKMGVCLSGYYKERLIVCDVDDKGIPIYWVARDITGKADKSNKLWNPSADENIIGSSDILFNFSLAKNYDTVIITEGVFDSIWVGANGLASYGTGLKRNHLYWLLKGGFKKVVFCYDPDVKDYILEKNAILTAQFFDTYICKLTKGDPDEHEKADLNKLIMEAPKFIPSRLRKIAPIGLKI